MIFLQILFITHALARSIILQKFWTAKKTKTNLPLSTFESFAILLKEVLRFLAFYISKNLK